MGGAALSRDELQVFRLHNVYIPEGQGDRFMSHQSQANILLISRVLDEVKWPNFIILDKSMKLRFPIVLCPPHVQENLAKLVIALLKFY